MNTKQHGTKHNKRLKTKLPTVPTYMISNRRWNRLNLQLIVTSPCISAPSRKLNPVADGEKEDEEDKEGEEKRI